MHVIESLILSSPGDQPVLYLRYIDDILGVWTHGARELNNRVYRQRGFSLRSKEAHEIMWRWHVKIQNMAKFSQKIAFPIGTRGQKRSNFPKMSYISRNSPVVQKLEQLEQNRKKYLKAHSAGYRRLHIGFELNPRPDTVFRHLRSDRGWGGWCDPPPWRFQTKRRRA